MVSDRGQAAFDVREAARATTLVATLVALTNVAALAFDPRDRLLGAIFVVDLCHGALALLVTIYFARRTPRSVGWCEFGFALVTLPFLVGLWLPAIANLESGLVSEPLMPHHFVLLGIAIGAPTRRIGLPFVALFAVQAFALARVFSTEGAEAVVAHEPWMTILFAALAGLMLHTRSRRRALEQRVVAAEERARMLGEVARMLLALRDRANTPLQTIEIAVELLAEEGAGPDHIAVMQRSLARLALVQQALSKSSAELASLAGDDGISPVGLEQALHELLRRDSRPRA
jgi:signal transduction histidine kinase